MSFLTRAYGATKLALKAKAPTIMVVTGVASMGAAAVIGARQTLKVEEVLEKHTPNLEKIQKGQDLDLGSYTQEDAQRDRGRVYAAAAFDLTKLYAVPGVLFIGGAGLVFGGHRMMVKRNAQLAIAFTGLKKMFDGYRGRVQDKLGHEADQAFLNGATVKEVIDPATGEVATIATRDWDKSREDPYNRVFAQDTSSEWQDDYGVNKMFILQQVKSAQQVLNLQGHLYLNDLYQALGFPKTDIGQVAGWRVRRLADGSRDIPTIDVGLDKMMPDDWKYNNRNEIFLDINCQGYIVGGTVQKLLEQA